MYNDYCRELERLLRPQSPPKQTIWPDMSSPRSSTPSRSFTPLPSISNTTSLFSSPAESRSSPASFLYDDYSNMGSVKLAPIAGKELSDALMAQLSPDHVRSRRDSAYGSSDECSLAGSTFSPLMLSPASSPPPVSPPMLKSYGFEFPPKIDLSYRDEFERNGIESALDDADRQMRHSMDNKKVTSSTKGHQGRLNQILECPETREELQKFLREQSLKKPNKKKPMSCAFCKSNNEREDFYTTHQLKDSQNRVTCPILYILKCPKCGARGPNAHTLKYCPLTGDDYVDTKAVRMTARTAAGRRRHPRY